MKDFKCCLGCKHRCEDCHSTCQAYKKELSIYKIKKEFEAQKEKSRKEYRSYEGSKARKIEKATRRKHR